MRSRLAVYSIDVALARWPGELMERFGKVTSVIGLVALVSYDRGGGGGPQPPSR